MVGVLIFTSMLFIKYTFVQCARNHLNNSSLTAVAHSLICQPTQLLDQLESLVLPYYVVCLAPLSCLTFFNFVTVGFPLIRFIA